MFDVASLDQELRAAGVPIHGCASDGRVDFKPEATDAHRAKAEEVKAAHNAEAARAERRRPVLRYVEVCGLLRAAKAEAGLEFDSGVKAVLDKAVTRLEAEKAALRPELTR